MEKVACSKRSGREQCTSPDQLLHADEQLPSTNASVSRLHRNCGRCVGDPEICWWSGGCWRRWPDGIGPSDVLGQCQQNSPNGVSQYRPGCDGTSPVAVSGFNNADRYDGNTDRRGKD